MGMKAQEAEAASAFLPGVCPEARRAEQPLAGRGRAPGTAGTGVGTGTCASVFIPMYI